MEKKRMKNDKIIIDYSNREKPLVHRLAERMPEFQRNYGLWIINTSLNVHTDTDGFRRCPERKFEFYSVSHLIEGGGRLWIKGQDEQELFPGTLVTITPGTLNRYGGNGRQPYVEDSIRFCGPVADMMAASGILVSGASELGTIRRLCPIAELAADPSRDSQIHANIQLQDLLTELYFRNRERSRSSKMEELIRLIQSDLQHWWTVEELAELASLSCEVLRRRFLAHTGMLPKTYLEEYKLRCAAEQLLTTDFPVGKIARLLGYNDPYHFSRRFKRRMGSSPELYRRQFPKPRSGPVS